MGVSYSSECVESGPDNLLDCKNVLRSCAVDAKLFIDYYSDSCMPPMIDKIRLESMIYVVSKKAGQAGKDTSEIYRKVPNAIWEIFNIEQRHIIVQEVLTTLALLSPWTWVKRAELLFSIYKSSSSDSIGHDEIAFCAQSSAHALCRLWGTPIWRNEELSSQCNDLAAGAYTKLGLELEEDIQREGFTSWLVGRFKEGKSVVSGDALQSMYLSPYGQITSDLVDSPL